MNLYRFSPLRRVIVKTTGFVMACSVSALVHAQGEWPTKPVRIVIGFAPGGTTDVMARALAHLLTESLGQTLIVENKPGASGNIAAAEAARAAPDGYTFLVAPTSVETANPSLFKAQIQPARDLTPVMGLGRTQMYVIAKPALPVKDVRELVTMAKANPGKLSYASAGAGTPPHLAGEPSSRRRARTLLMSRTRVRRPRCRT